MSDAKTPSDDSIETNSSNSADVMKTPSAFKNTEPAASEGDTTTGAEVTSEGETRIPFLKTMDEDTVTVEEIMREVEYLDNQARLLLGGEDDKVCTFPEGYKPRQALFSCLTCTPGPIFAGVCLGCSLHCHEGHNIVEMYTKRRFRCDCGNSKFNGKKCSLYEEKDALNPRNQYNQNFEGYFCTKKCMYPDPYTDEEMIQCVLCEDWFHFTHLGMPKLSDEGIAEVELICSGCVTKHPWMSALRTEDPAVCVSSVVEKTTAVENEGSGDKTDKMKGGSAPEQPQVQGVLLPCEEWRKKICSCNKCEALLETSGLDFIRDAEDPISVYEEESRKKTEQESGSAARGSAEGEMASMLAKESGPDVAIKMMEEFNSMKSELVTFMEGLAKNNQVVTPHHVTTFFEELRRKRMEQ